MGTEAPHRGRGLYPLEAQSTSSIGYIHGKIKGSRKEFLPWTIVPGIRPCPSGFSGFIHSRFGTGGQAA